MTDPNRASDGMLRVTTEHNEEKCMTKTQLANYISTQYNIPVTYAVVVVGTLEIAPLNKVLIKDRALYGKSCNIPVVPPEQRLNPESVLFQFDRS